MKRHKLLWVMAIAGILTAVAGAVARSSTFRTPAQLASGTISALGAVQHWMRTAAAHVTTTQLVEAAALAWLIFVVSLVLLARSRPPQSQAKETPQDPANEVTLPDRTLPYRARVTDAVSHASIPALPLRPAPPEDPSPYQESTYEAPRAHAAGSPAIADAAPKPSAEQRIASEEQAAYSGWGANDFAVQPARGHMLALTGVALARNQLLPYGLFIVAADTGSAGSGGEASFRAVKVIAEQMAPALAGSRALESAHLAALLKMAVLRASMDLCQERIFTATDRGAAITAAMVMDGVVHVVNVGSCRLHVFRPRDGLTQITMDRLAMLRFEGDEPLDLDVLPPHPQHDPTCLDIRGSQPPYDVDTLEVHAYPDDLFLLSSPGLWQALRQTQVEGILRTATTSRSAASLLAREGAGRVRDEDFGVIVVRPLEAWMPSFGIAAARAGLP